MAMATVAADKVVKNLENIQRIDNSAKQIVLHCTQAALYDFNLTDNKWKNTEMMGPLFVYERKESPFHSIYIANRQSLNDYLEPIMDGLTFKYDPPYILIHKDDGSIRGIWVYGEDECKRVYAKIAELHNQLKNKENNDTPLIMQLNDQQNKIKPNISIDSSTGNILFSGSDGGLSSLSNDSINKRTEQKSHMISKNPLSMSFQKHVQNIQSKVGMQNMYAQQLCPSGVIKNAVGVKSSETMLPSGIIIRESKSGNTDSSSSVTPSGSRALVTELLKHSATAALGGNKQKLHGIATGGGVTTAVKKGSPPFVVNKPKTPPVLSQDKISTAACDSDAEMEETNKVRIPPKTEMPSPPTATSPSSATMIPSNPNDTKELKILREIVLCMVKRIDVFTEELIFYSPKAVLYEFKVAENKWKKTDTEGPLIVFKRLDFPLYSLLIHNQNNDGDFVQPLMTGLKIKYNLPYIFLSGREDGGVYGIWMQSQAECKQVFAILARLMKEVMEKEAIETAY